MIQSTALIKVHYAQVLLSDHLATGSHTSPDSAWAFLLESAAKPDVSTVKPVTLKAFQPPTLKGTRHIFCMWGMASGIDFSNIYRTGYSLTSFFRFHFLLLAWKSLLCWTESSSALSNRWLLAAVIWECCLSLTDPWQSGLMIHLALWDLVYNAYESRVDVVYSLEFGH